MAKTVDVLTILQKGNKALESGFVPDVGAPGVSPDVLARAYRWGIASLVETLLHESGNYAGFMYLDNPYRAGVTDESRRFYYLSKRLAKVYARQQRDTANNQASRDMWEREVKNLSRRH